MRLIAPSGGRVIVRWSPEDVIPARGYSLAMLFAAIGGRYVFQDIPNPVQAQLALNQAQAMGMTGGMPTTPVPATFRSGHFATAEGLIALFQLDIFLGMGALSVTSQTTEGGDLFIDDLIIHLEGTLGLHDVREKSTRLYASAVVVEFERGIEEYISAIGRAVELIQKKSGTHDRGSALNFERIAFGCDGFRTPMSDAFGYTNLVIERRSQVPFETNRYHCTGPFRTDEFVELLEQLETAFASGDGPRKGKR
jgi:hypothetical protein